MLQQNEQLSFEHVVGNLELAKENMKEVKEELFDQVLAATAARCQHECIAASRFYLNDPNWTTPTK